MEMSREQDEEKRRLDRETVKLRAEVDAVRAKAEKINKAREAMMSDEDKKDEIEPESVMPLGLLDSSEAPGDRFQVTIELVDYEDLFGRMMAMQKEIEERDETVWMLRLDTGDDAEHKSEHVTKRDVACRFCRLEIYNEEQAAKEAESIAERKRATMFIENMIPVAIADCCATCEHFYPASKHYEEDAECRKHDIGDVDDGYGVKCRDWEAE